jgi:hypothetical protein
VTELGATKMAACCDHGDRNDDADDVNPRFVGFGCAHGKWVGRWVHKAGGGGGR